MTRDCYGSVDFSQSPNILLMVVFMVFFPELFQDPNSDYVHDGYAIMARYFKAKDQDGLCPDIVWFSFLMVEISKKDLACFIISLHQGNNSINSLVGMIPKLLEQEARLVKDNLFSESVRDICIKHLKSEESLKFFLFDFNNIFH
jgi:hypothetical protein